MRVEDRSVYEALGTWAYRATLTALLGIPGSALGSLSGLYVVEGGLPGLKQMTWQEAVTHAVPAAGTSIALLVLASEARGMTRAAHQNPPRGLGGPASWYTRASDWMLRTSTTLGLGTFVMVAFTLYAMAYTVPEASLRALFALGLPTLWMGICGNPIETRLAILREDREEE